MSRNPGPPNPGIVIPAVYALAYLLIRWARNQGAWR